MASRHRLRTLLELSDQRVEVRDDPQRSAHDGTVTVAEEPGGVTLTLSADPTAAREQSMSVTLPPGEAAALERALADARAEE